MNISMRIISIVAIVAFLSIISLANANVLNMPEGLTSLETVRVGNAWNSNDTWGDGHGQVAYEYNIGKYEVTAGQYTEFLNAVASTDTYGLYNPKMWSDYFGCKIWRQWSPSGYSYSVADDWANRPVNFVSWGDAARFCNWMQNGQPTGMQVAETTEVGAYALNGATTNARLMSRRRKTDWQWAIPTEDEWYKAAYHANNGLADDYFDYPTASNEKPSNDLVEPDDPGNNATFREGGGDYTVRSPYWRTEVGAHENSASPYGTFDQGGGLYEWNETAFYGWARGLRGGSFEDPWGPLHAGNYTFNSPGAEHNHIGFRVAHVPEPTTVTFIIFASLLCVTGRIRDGKYSRGSSH